MKFYASIARVQRRRYMFLPMFFLPPTKEEIHVFARVRLSVCLLALQDYSKTRAWIWMKCCVSTDVGTWTN